MAVTKFGERGLGEIRGLTFCEGTITDLTLKFPEFCKHPVSNAESTPWEDYQRWAPYEGGFATGGAIARRLRWSSMPPPATGRDGGRTKFPCVDAIGDRIGRG